MKVKVSKTKISKSGKSTNFMFGGNRYSVKNSLLQRMRLNNINGLEINITEYDIFNGWYMIYGFKVNGAVPKAKKVKTIENIDFTKPAKQEVHENFQKVIESVTAIKVEEDDPIEEFSPFDIIGIKFCVYEGRSYTIEHSDEEYPINEKYNKFIAVIQNLFTRSKSYDLMTSDEIDPLATLLLLESFKKNLKNPQLIVPVGFKPLMNKTINELKETIKTFAVLIDQFPKEQMIDYIDAISISFTKSNKYQVLSGEIPIIEVSETKDSKYISQLSFISTSNIKYNDLLKVKKELNKILKLVFYNKETKISQLKDEQIDSLNKLMNGEENILAVLKTGFGKSLIYQFASILQPRIFLNVFPINSLISDQTISLENEFKLSYIIDNDKLKSLDEKSINKKLLSHKRMFMITPERLENMKMQYYFENLNKMIGYMIFDEAHCISEWGHDFRPSYLMARHLMENLTKNGRLNVIALTATAAPHIQKDIANLLSIKMKNVINIADSSGLKRDEIEYKIIKEDVDDFDRWNRSNKYAEIVDGYIARSMESSKQGIAFFMKSGSEKDLDNNKFLFKNNAYSAFKRLGDKTGVGLFTGKTKIIDDETEPVPFDKFQKSKYIIATKSFGMGINLKDCNYVLLTEPPYSLEDLYQQAGRVGRVGQKSLVEILYHRRSLMDPLSPKSPYKFFLMVDDKRKKGQLDIAIKLSKLIISQSKPFEFDISVILGKWSDEKQTYLKWAISHLITEFGLIDKYYVVYGGKFRIKKIGIFPNKVSYEKLVLNINKKNERLGLEYKADVLDKAFDVYYKYYFEKLQNDKLIGINILCEKLEEIEHSNKNSGEAILDSLTQYYKTRVDEIDKEVIELYDLMKAAKPIEEIVKHIDKASRKHDTFELMESISRYSINADFIEAASFIMCLATGEGMLISNKKNASIKRYTLNYLNEIRDSAIYKLVFESQRNEDDELMDILDENKGWKNIKEKILIKKVMEELNG